MPGEEWKVFREGIYVVVKSPSYAVVLIYNYETKEQLIEKAKELQKNYKLGEKRICPVCSIIFEANDPLEVYHPGCLLEGLREENASEAKERNPK